MSTSFREDSTRQNTHVELRGAKMTPGKRLTGFALYISALALVLPSHALAKTTSPNGSDIIGGEIVPRIYPWSVALVERGGGPITSRFFCSASLIEPQWVVTARHCTESPSWPGNGDVIVVIGRRDLSSLEGQTRSVSTVYQHPIADIALIRLTTSSTQQDLQLAGPGESADWGVGSEARIYGYGVFEFGGTETSEFLRRAELQIDLFTSDHFDLLASFSGRTACYGDSGGPFITSTRNGARLIGVIYGGQIDEQGRCVLSGDNYLVKTGYRSSRVNSPIYFWIQDIIP
jgi:trypsin